jgi:hypothetical protein
VDAEADLSLRDIPPLQAIPLINFGSYTICLEFIFVALCVALLAVGPPSIVASSGAIPSGWPKVIVCVLGFIIVAWQVLGIVSIKTEKTALYRTYIRINFLLTLITLIVTLAFFAVSAARHSAALESCVALYGNTPAGSSSSSDLTNVGETICSIFIWVQVGCMGLLIILIGLTQVSDKTKWWGVAWKQSQLLKASSLAVHVLLSTSVWTEHEKGGSGPQVVSCRSQQWSAKV